MRMTEYSVEKFYDEYALKKEDTIIAVIDAGTNARKVCDLLNEQSNEIQRCKLAYNQLSSYVDANFDEYMTQKKLNERIKELQQTIDTIAKDYEESHGMDIRNAEWFTAW